MMDETTMPVVLTGATLATEIVPIRDIKLQLAAIQEAMRDVMQPGQDYGLIPGCGPKPTLLKPGAEIIGLLFRLEPKFEVTIKDLGNNHREYTIQCRLERGGANMGEGVGSCSTMESKYRWRQADRRCPKCGAAAIIAGKAEYGGGWLCFAKKGGCGAKFAKDDASITGQALGRVENPDIADVWNTCLKIAKKRSYVDAILTRTAASRLFTEDVEDFAEGIQTVDADDPKEYIMRKPQASGATPKRGRPRAETTPTGASTKEQAQKDLPLRGGQLSNGQTLSEFSKVFAEYLIANKEEAEAHGLSGADVLMLKEAVLDGRLS